MIAQIVHWSIYGEKKMTTLYERLGGIFAIAAVVDYFSDELIQNQTVGRGSKNPALAEWHRRNLDRLPGLKWMRTLWVAEITGGPYKYIPTVPGTTPLDLGNAHAKFNISSREFDEVAKVLKHSLEYFKVPEVEMQEVLGAFIAHKIEVVKE